MKQAIDVCIELILCSLCAENQTVRIIIRNYLQRFLFCKMRLNVAIAFVVVVLWMKSDDDDDLIQIINIMYNINKG